MAKCPNTRLTIPECSCSRWLDEQIRSVAPALLEKDSARIVSDSGATAAQRAPARA